MQPSRPGRLAVVLLTVVAVVAVAVIAVGVLTRPTPQGAPAAASPSNPAPSHPASPSTTTPNPSPTPSDQCPDGSRLSRPDRTVRADYAVSGYFVFTDPDRCATRAKVQGAHAIGADTLVTFGAELTPTTVRALRATGDDNRFSGFTVDGEDGYRHARGRTGGGSIRDVFTYANKTTFSDAALFCPDRDGRTHTAQGYYTWWLLPVEGGYSDCDSPSRTYDLVVAWSGSALDADTVLVDDAARFGMSVYLGLPKPAPDPQVAYVANTSSTQTLGGFTSRVLADWRAKFGHDDAFAGAYQSLETGVFTNVAVWQPNLTVYELQNRIVGFRLPRDKQRVVVSPYADLRRGQVPLSAVRPALQRIADTASGVRLVLAPQDGGGTGRVGVFRRDQADQEVRADLRGVVGGATYGEAYAASTAQLYAEAATVHGAVLWANVEAFRPEGKVGHRAPGRLDALDAQVAAARGHVTKVIAYRWDDYLDTSGLAGQIAARG